MLYALRVTQQTFVGQLLKASCCSVVTMVKRGRRIHSPMGVASYEVTVVHDIGKQQRICKSRAGEGWIDDMSAVEAES